MQNEAELARGSLPPPIIFERQILPKQIIYRCKGNLTASRVHFNPILTGLFANLKKTGGGGGDAPIITWLFQVI